MSQHEPNIRLSLARSELPQLRTVEDWLADVISDDVEKNTSVIKYLPLLFEELDIDPATLVDKAHVTGMVSLNTGYLDAGSIPQYALARNSMTSLADAFDCDAGLKHCGLLIYSHTGVDEEPVHSTVCWLASEFELSRIPSFAVSQLQGACFFQAIDVARGFFHSDPALQSALLVAAEKWSLPYPRVLPHRTVLSDGAVSIWLERSQSVQGLEICDSQVHCFTDFGDVYRQSAYPDQDTHAMSEKVTETINALLKKHHLVMPDISVLAHAGLTSSMNNQVEKKLAVALDTVIVETPPEYGYLSAAHAPYVTAKVLEMAIADNIQDGAYVIVWGIGVGGSVGAVLMRVCNQ